jgi:hypothetical protein
MNARNRSAATARSKLNVAHACKALALMNRVLRSPDLPPDLRERMQRARHRVRCRIALRASDRGFAAANEALAPRALKPADWRRSSR